MKCKYSNEFLEYSCDRDEYKDGYCIFHCDKENFTEEEIDEFKIQKKKIQNSNLYKFWEEFERQEKDEKVTVFNFIGFKFPAGFSFEGKVFKKAVNFNSANFVGHINFKGTVFNEEANFTGATFNARVIFEDARFSRGVIFSSTIFMDGANFIKANFNVGEGYSSHPSYFSGKEFYGSMDFSNALFKDASFKSVTFSDTVHFLNANFKDRVNFEDTKFLKDVFFEKSIFSLEKEGSVIFKNVTFEERVYFNNSEFLNDTLFENTKFTLESFFVESRFTKTKFEEVDFSKPVSFENARFGGATWFKNVRFFENVVFKGSEFRAKPGFGDKNIQEAIGSDNLYLGSATTSGALHYFSGRTRFVLGKVGSDVEFEGVIFGKDAEFEKTLFGGSANFFNTQFFGNINFKHARFYNSVRFIGENDNKVFPKESAIVDFSFSTFQNPELVEFVDVNLTRAKFLHCKGIDRIRFAKVEWKPEEENRYFFMILKKIFKINVKRNAIFDETAADEGNQEDYDFVAEVYKKLRLNYERNLRFSEAGDFYIGEMEMRRRDAKFNKRKIDHILLTLYKYFSYYGEDVRLPVFWMSLITLVFAFYYAPITWSNIFSFEYGDIFRFLGYWATSIMTFFQMPPMKPEEQTFWIFIERLLGVLFSALFILAIRRKLKKGGE